MADTVGQRPELSFGQTGVRVARVCGAVVALLLVAAVVYGIVAAIGNYAQIAV